MAETPLLPTFPGTLPTSMDFNALLAEGIAYVQATSGDVWTDFNEHDPGLTVLEQLCYALTDLGLRSRYEIADLLTNERQFIDRDTLFTGDRILTSAPISGSDYREVMYDRVQGLKNFWLEPVEGMPGLYRGWIERFRWGPEPQALVEQVRKILRANRTLCEDVDELDVLAWKTLELAGRLELAADADPDDVMGRVFFDLDCKLVPQPLLIAVDAQVAEGEPFDRIYEGPRLEYGAADDSQLAARPTCVTLHQIASVVHAVPGVRLLSNLRFSNTDQASLALKNEVPFVEIPQRNQPQPRWPFELVDSTGQPAPIDADRVIAAFRKCVAEARARENAVKRCTDGLDYRRLPSGRFLDIERYYSIQHQFPTTYGLSRYGIQENFALQTGTGIDGPTSLPNTGAAAVKRAAQVKQLRGYLMLYEQLLADAFAQLANVRRLFSLRPGRAESYFVQSLLNDAAVDFPDPNGIRELLRDEPEEDREHDCPRRRYTVCVREPVGGEPGGTALISVPCDGLADARQLAKTIAERCVDPAHYLCASWARGRIAIVLVDATCEIIAHGQERYHTLTRARRAARRLALRLRNAKERGGLARFVEIRRQHASETGGLLPIREHSAPSTPDERYLARLKRLMAQFDDSPRRRNMFLNHLLARFNERFDDDSLQRFDPRPAAADRFLDELADCKRSFLTTYAHASRRRASGFDYGMKRAAPMPFGSGLEHRLYSLLGIGGRQRFARYPRSLARLTDRHPGYEFERRRGAAGGEKAARAERELDGFVFDAGHPAVFTQLLRYGADLARYTIEREADARRWVLHFLSPGDTHRVLTATDPERLERYRDDLIDWLRPDGAAGMHVFHGEGLYVLEHILLRPLAPPLQHDEDGFYGYRISILFPNWPARFQSDEFKRFAERLVRENSPAHVQADCYWLDFGQMWSFESSYEAWACAKYRSVRHDDPQLANLDKLSRHLRDFLRDLARGDAAP
ncbi:hypothetical protein [Trinickia dinghuensis]|uniref:Uncharacterized protein n=1 Tax=Trinickia dinghuensis TaxID=2291023 RepID=A0A3D8JY25_9BURK|nr:hypothetical protein [Trinickia dinghuensis]RDU97546.1 hypothetical protein DWV00_16815 [Trinickia dinghuensis]